MWAYNAPVKWKPESDVGADFSVNDMWLSRGGIFEVKKFWGYSWKVKKCKTSNKQWNADFWGKAFCISWHHYAEYRSIKRWYHNILKHLVSRSWKNTEANAVHWALSSSHHQEMTSLPQHRLHPSTKVMSVPAAVIIPTLLDGCRGEHTVSFHSISPSCGNNCMHGASTIDFCFTALSYWWLYWLT